MKKAVKGLLKLIGGIMVAAGAVLVVVSYLDELQGPRGKGQGALLPLPSRKRRLGRVIPPIKTPALFREQRGGFIFRWFRQPVGADRVVRPYGCEGKFQIVQAGR